MAPIRSVTAHNKEVSTFGGAARHSWNNPDANQAFSMTVRLDPKHNAHLPPAQNPVNPPLHWHYKQREDFEIRQGSVIFTLDGKEFAKTKADGVISVYPGQYHTFRADPSSEGEVVLIITGERDDDGMSERFFRNLYSYGEDCNEQKIAQSIFQAFLFLYSSDTYPVLPGPKFIAQPLSRAITYLIGNVIGKGILGLKESYDEYYKPR